GGVPSVLATPPQDDDDGGAHAEPEPKDQESHGSIDAELDDRWRACVAVREVGPDAEREPEDADGDDGGDRATPETLARHGREDPRDEHADQVGHSREDRDRDREARYYADHRDEQRLHERPRPPPP